MSINSSTDDLADFDKFKSFVEQFLNDGIRYGRKVAGKALPLEDIEEIVQDALLVVWKTALNDPQFSSRFPSLEVYTKGIIHHKVVDRLRSTKEQFSRALDSLADYEENIQGGIEPEHLLVDVEDGQILWKAIGELDEDARQIIELYYFEGHDCQYIAQQLGKSLETIKKRLQRSKKKLSALMSDASPAKRHVG